jgi:hypothetical protein
MKYDFLRGNPGSVKGVEDRKLYGNNTPMIVSLSKVSIDEMYNTFLDAFCDYDIDLDMDIDRFEEMLRTRSYNKDLSLGY